MSHKQYNNNKKNCALNSFNIFIAHKLYLKNVIRITRPLKKPTHFSMKVPHLLNVIL